MKTRVVIFVAAVALMALATPRVALAQSNFRGHADNPNGPTVSPYLNLLQNSNFGATNYQTLVKPFIDQGNAIDRQGSSLQRLQKQVNSQAQNSGRSGTTGHTTQFMNTSHFYPQRRAPQASR